MNPLDSDPKPTLFPLCSTAYEASFFSSSMKYLSNQIHIDSGAIPDSLFILNNSVSLPVQKGSCYKNRKTMAVKGDRIHLHSISASYKLYEPGQAN